MTKWFNILLHAVFGFIGGLLYVLIEIVWRGYSHISMFFLGGLCFVLIGLLDEVQRQPHIIRQMTQGAVIVTALELVTGLILNVWLGLNVWSYSDMPFNLMGQICLPFSVAWFFLSWVAIKAENLMHKIYAKITGFKG